MKSLVRLLAVLLALVMCLSCVSLAEEVETYDYDTVLLIYDGDQYTLNDMITLLNTLKQSGYNIGYSDLDRAISYQIQQLTWEAQMDKLGLKNFTAEEEAELQKEAERKGKLDWDTGIQQYIDYYKNTDEGKNKDNAMLKAEAVTYYNMYGLDPQTLTDMYYEELANQKASDALMALVLAGKKLEPTEEDIQAMYLDAVEQDKTLMESQAGLYEQYVNVYGYYPMYTPEGYRGVIHILMKVDDELKAAYDTAVADLGKEGTEVTQVDVDAAKNAVLASRQKEIDDIFARLEKGETFQSLIALYGEDPGMKNETYLNDGYAICADSTIYDPVFTAAAFSDKMNKPGDVSDPVIGMSGIHILYYLRDIPAGGEEMDEELHNEIYTFLCSQYESQALNEEVARLTEDHEIYVNEKAVEYFLGGH